jgi:hypothetical protein
MLSPHTAALVAALTVPPAPVVTPILPPTMTDSSVPACPDPPGLLSARDRKANVKVAIAGAAVFAVFYGTATALAAHELDDTRGAADDHATRDRRRIAHLMFVPVLGPFVATPLGPSKADRAGFAGFGLMQTFGLAMLGGALFNLARDRTARRLSVSGNVTATQGFVALRGRF